MIIRKAVFILILFASMTCSGCFTAGWNNMMKPKIDTRLSTKSFSHGPDSFGIDDGGKYPAYKKCDYIGTEAVEGFQYHHYMCPNMYNDSEYAFLEMFIPFAESGNRAAIIKSVNQRVIPAKRSNIHDPVYIHFYNSINPNFIRDHVDRSLGVTPFTTNIPSLIALNFNQRSGKVVLEVWQRMDKEFKELHTSDELLRLSGQRCYAYVCPETKDQYPINKWSKYNYNYLSTRADCDLWYWSYAINASGTLKTNDKVLWKVARDIGYIITVPADVITLPIQLIGMLLIRELMPGH